MQYRNYTEEYRKAACRLVTHEGYSVAAAAKSLGIGESTVTYWLRSRGPADPPRVHQ